MSTAAMPKIWPTVVHMLADAASRNPDGVALVCGDETLTYRAYAACVSGVAHDLATLGIGAGERVALVMSNTLDIAVATFGVQASGAQVVPLNPAYTPAEFLPMLDNAACAAIIFDESVRPKLEHLLERFSPERQWTIGPDGHRLTRWRDNREFAATLPLPDAGGLSTLQYTGGTSGVPKGVILSHGNVATNIAQREALLPTKPGEERVLVITPLFHSYASAMGLYLAAYARSTLVILPKFTPEDVFAAVTRHRITLFGGSPTIFNGLMRHEAFGTADWSSLRLCYSGSAALAEETLRRWEAATGCDICEGYGQTEAGPVLTYNPEHGSRKIGSVGIVLPQTEVEIVDVETGQTVLGPDEKGEIRARGPQIMQGYRDRPEETAISLRDGWLYTGDIGEFDADGYLFIRDRKKEMVIVSGYNVYPREVEEALFTHADVAEAAVIGRPDSYRGEKLIAFLVLHTGRATHDEAIRAFLETRLARYKIPSEFRFVPELPRTTVGKIDKLALKSRTD